MILDFVFVNTASGSVDHAISHWSFPIYDYSTVSTITIPNSFHKFLKIIHSSCKSFLLSVFSAIYIVLRQYQGGIGGKYDIQNMRPCVSII